MTNRTKEFINMVDHLADVPEQVKLKEKEIAEGSPYRQKYHVESESGTLGDPNGFSYFNGNYHLFYQWSPLAFSQNPHYTQHGWNHLISSDLVHWHNLGGAIESDTKYDKYGTYSGSAIPVDDKLLLTYTGNTWINTFTKNDWHRKPYQLTAFMNQNNQVVKSNKPIIIDSFPGYTGHFRDPKIWRQNEEYFAILGAQRENMTGTALVIHSKNLKKWNLIGELGTAYKKLGYMWECPDYFDLENHGVLVFCPQGLQSSGDKYRNIYQTCYLIGDKVKFPETEFKHGPLMEMDQGFDFYATQSMSTQDGRRILVAWMGLPETQYPTMTYHYSGCLTIPRELKVRAGKLYQSPIAELQSLRTEKMSINQHLIDEQTRIKLTQSENEYDLAVNFKGANAVTIDLFADKENQRNFKIILNKKKQEMIIDRSKSGKEFSVEYGSTRKIDLKIGQEVKLQIFTDKSSVEIFVNDGEYTFTSRVFPDRQQMYLFFNSISGSASVEGTIYKMNSLND